MVQVFSGLTGICFGTVCLRALLATVYRLWDEPIVRAVFGESIVLFAVSALGWYLTAGG